jgi:pimeloyl-ACP methyl ester carboxylesterase
VKALGIPDLGDEFRQPVRSEVPVLLILGTLDGRTSEADAKTAGQQFTRATYITINRASHDFFFRLQPEVAEVINAFLSGTRVEDTRIEAPVRFRGSW